MGIKFLLVGMPAYLRLLNGNFPSKYSSRFFIGRSSQEKDVTWEMAHILVFLQLVNFFRDSAMVFITVFHHHWGATLSKFRIGNPPYFFKA